MVQSLQLGMSSQADDQKGMRRLNRLPPRRNLGAGEGGTVLAEEVDGGCARLGVVFFRPVECDVADETLGYAVAAPQGNVGIVFSAFIARAMLVAEPITGRGLFQ